MAGTKLLPCPFCGGEARTASKDYGDTHYWRVFCDTPSCAMCMTGVFHSEPEAVAAWNTRAGCKNCAALNRAAGLWAKADKRARELEQEIVRCRDCKFRREYKTLNEVECLLFDDTTFEPQPDGFCAWGVRRDA